MAENQQLGHGRSQPSAPPSQPPPSTVVMGTPVGPPPPAYLRQHQAADYEAHTTHTSAASVVHIGIINPAPPPPLSVIEEQTTIIVTKARWTCCGMGIGWFLFVLGWFLCGIPWFAGFFVLICGRYDRREKAGLLACATFAVVISVVATVNAIKGDPHKTD